MKVQPWVVSLKVMLQLVEEEELLDTVSEVLPEEP